MLQRVPLCRGGARAASVVVGGFLSISPAAAASTLRICRTYATTPSDPNSNPSSPPPPPPPPPAEISPSSIQTKTKITSPPLSSPLPPLSSSSSSSSTKTLPLPPSRSPHTSSKLSALHARLYLSPSFPLETLARCLIDPTAEPNPKFNNATLSNLGNNLLGYYTSEHLLVNWPRLPLDVLKAAIHAYISPQALYQLGREWGVEAAFEPTLECDAGLLQFGRLKPGEPWGPQKFYKTGDEKALAPPAFRGDKDIPETQEGITLSHATANFVKALFGSIHLHESPSAAHHFFKQHILSRHLDVSKLFNFIQPTRHLSRLCAREGFQSPVARLISETGRKSRSAVFIVGAYSGAERLGEGYGASIDEARIKSAVSALKGWYLYSPTVGGNPGDVPSRMEMYEEDAVVASKNRRTRGERFRAAFVDVGEVIV